MTSSFQRTNGQISARIADPFVIIDRMVEDDGRWMHSPWLEAAGGWPHPATRIGNAADCRRQVDPQPFTT
ncbi:hypothetical protein [Aliirhizobium cellulosilyticum]|uniref:Uncharacterized protein n=1 Tax=Aliirhizobium cellulosilyticum TaxID=393664 RepID=A0A7W6S820_9HYPH|nr:hypothetical protein [Rhizobium cellulosilyticum]MBB4348911.1 hypothetical protein [Rhizobium cellulosilyticum]MBB4412868.1 hypothetical protein [Rhizobium cellulosilyticum]MBB4447500.1 hypothetical protein [Rhizobium cellulosilyticum]